MDGKAYVSIGTNQDVFPLGITRENFVFKLIVWMGMGAR